MDCNKCPIQAIKCLQSFAVFAGFLTGAASLSSDPDWLVNKTHLHELSQGCGQLRRAIV